jgi:alpha-mannosidase
MFKSILIFSLLIFFLGVFSRPCLSQLKAGDNSGSLADMNLHIIPQSHIDLSWWWRYDPEAIQLIAKHTLETAFENMEKFPDYTFTYLQVPMIEPLEDIYPELFYKLRYYAHNREAIGSGYPNPGAGGDKGRLAIGSGMWCEVDGSIPCGESLVRNCLYGKRYYKHHFGIDVKTAWVQDAWTHPWTYPQILSKCGITSYMYTRPRPEELFMLVPDSLKERYLSTITKKQDDNMFWWESPDGSRVFAYKPLRLGGENLPSGEAIEKYLSELSRKYGVLDGITLIGVGNHGGGAIKADVERMESIMKERNSGIPEKMRQPGLIFSTPMKFTSAIMEHPGNFPVIKDELVPTIRGAYSTVGEIKRGNRKSETLLMTLEKFSSVASVLGVVHYPDKAINSAWKKLMINQFHDPISGTDVNPSVDDVLLRFQQIKDTSANLLNKNLSLLSGNINTFGEGIPVVIFNPLSWIRTDLVEAEFELPAGTSHFSVSDEKNKKTPVQIIDHISDNKVNRIKIVFVAKNIPSIGYSTFRLIPEINAPADKNMLSINRFLLENEFFSIKIDSLTGCLDGIIDKKNNREILDKKSSANMIQIIDDYGDSEGFLMSPEGFGEYNKWAEKSSDLIDFTEITIVENGPVRAILQIKRKYNLASFIQRIIIYQGINRIDFELIADWQGKNKMVKVAFPLNVASDSATYEIPYGVISRPGNGEEQVAQNWVDISDDNYGVSLLNDSRYGYDVSKNMIRLSILRSPDHPVDATDEKGTHRVEYSLYPHAGNWQTANTMARGYEFNYPLIVVKETNHTGPLPIRHSFIEISPENMIVTALKKAEDSDDLVLRFYETKGEGNTAKIKLSPTMGIDAVHRTDLLETELENITLNKNEFEVKVGKFSIETFKLIKDHY